LLNSSVLRSDKGISVQLKYLRRIFTDQMPYLTLIYLLVIEKEVEFRK
jgi:hypothetical protein